MERKTNRDGIDKLPGGKYRARINVPARIAQTLPKEWARRLTQTFTHKTDAVTWRAKQLADLSRGTWKHPKQIEAEAKAAREAEELQAVTLNTFFPMYMKAVKDGGGKSSTLIDYESIYKNAIKDDLGDVKLVDITRQRIARWRLTLAQRGKSDHAITKAEAQLRRILKEAYEQELLETLPRPSKRPKRPQPTKPK